MKYINENYDQVHGQILDNMKEEYDHWKEIHDDFAQDSDQKDICRSKMERITRRASKLA